MKYKVGDRVKIKSLDWYNDNANNEMIVRKQQSSVYFTKYMSSFCGKIATIIGTYPFSYKLNLDKGDCGWLDWMFEDEFEVKKNKDLIPNVLNAESLEEKRFHAACCAMQGILSGIISGVGLNQIDYPGIVKESYSLADEMIEQGGFNE